MVVLYIYVISSGSEVKGFQMIALILCYVSRKHVTVFIPLVAGRKSGM